MMHISKLVWGTMILSFCEKEKETWYIAVSAEVTKRSVLKLANGNKKSVVNKVMLYMYFQLDD